MSNGPTINPPDGEEKARRSIDTFKNLVEEAEVVEVDEPSILKEVEIAWEDSEGFHTESGEAYGVTVREGRSADGYLYTVQWVDRSSTTVCGGDLVDLDEGEWYRKG